MPASIYLFVGPEFGERNDKIDSVKADLKREFGEIDEFLFYATDIKVSEVVNQLSSESLFSTGTCIVLKNAEIIKKKDEIEMIGAWIKSCTIKSNVLILVSDETSVDSKLDKLIPKENKKIFWEMFENRKEDWIRNFFQKNGYKIAPDVASLILDMVENNTEALRSECSRFFFCFPKDHVITSQDVEQILAHNREENAFTLFDAMSESGVNPTKRFENSLLVLQKILLSKSSGGTVMLLSGLVSCFRKLAVWHSIHSNGNYPSDIDLKASGFASKKAQTQYSNASRVWNYPQCAAIIALLGQTDMDIRSGGTAFQDTQLFLLIYEIVIKKGVSCSKYELD